MPVRATVIMPTHNHGATLPYSIQSVLNQTVREFELFVIGDGAGDDTRLVVDGFLKADGRVRFFDFPKGPRLGEAYRHGVLQEASGDIVCYLSDDDLMRPNHLETMLCLLEDADFAHTLPVRIEPDDAVAVWAIDLHLPVFRERILSGINFIPLSCAAHTTPFYRSLPFGWRTTPEGIPTDMYMWQQCLSDPRCKAVSGTQPTIAHFPSSKRRTWTMEQRVEELERWIAVLAGDAPGWDWRSRVLDAVVRDRTALESERIAMQRTITWRVRNKLLAMPVAGPILRWLARAVSGRGER